MKSKTSFFALVAIAAGTLLGAASGCELIAGVDRTKIQTGGTGGTVATTGGTGGTTTTPMGGTGGTTTTPMGGTGGTGGSSSSGTTGPCMDAAKDCTGDPGECKVWTCDAMMMCAPANAMDGTDAATQKTGDCKKNVCMGGAPTPKNDDTDVEDDGTACTTDTCDMGTPKHTPVAAGGACSDNGGTVCDDMGKCVECNADGDCKDPLKPSCDTGNHLCVKAECGDGKKNGDETDTDCGGSCGPCDDNLACGVAKDCKSANCGMVNGALKCIAGTCVDGILNGLELGETDVDCGGSCPKCSHDKTCSVNADCKGDNCTMKKCVANCVDGETDQDESDTDCGGSTSMCSACPNTKACNGAADCQSGFCDGTMHCAACSADGDCGLGKYCKAGVCTTQIVTGQACSAANECASGACVDGRCCGSASCGTCQACNVVGSLGTCTNVPTMTPDDTCVGATKLCDGNGACKTTTGGACAMGSDCFSTNCADGVCCNQACSGTCVACNVAGSVGTCTNVPSGQQDANGMMACTGNNSCDGMGGCKKNNGQGCSAGTDCVSGICADGVCCDTACTGTCLACNLAGKVGTCSNIPAGTQDPNAMTPCTGTNACNGSGACKLGDSLSCAVNGDCANGHCVDGVCCNSACSGTCQACNNAGSVGTCSNIAQGGTDSNPACNGNSACNGMGSCLAAAGQPCPNGNSDCASNNCQAGTCQ
jgi:hypothetical protein